MADWLCWEMISVELVDVDVSDKWLVLFLDGLKSIEEGRMITMRMIVIVTTQVTITSFGEEPKGFMTIELHIFRCF